MLHEAAGTPLSRARPARSIWICGYAGAGCFWGAGVVERVKDNGGPGVENKTEARWHHGGVLVRDGCGRFGGARVFVDTPAGGGAAGSGGG